VRKALPSTPIEFTFEATPVRDNEKGGVLCGTGADTATHSYTTYPRIVEVLEHKDRRVGMHAVWDKTWRFCPWACL